MSGVIPLNQVQNLPCNWSVEGQDLMQSFGRPLYPGEKQSLQFLFANDVTAPNSIKLGVPPTVTVTCLAGNDQAPNSILAGIPTVNGTTVSVPVIGILPYAQYIIKVNVTTNIPTISPTVAGILTIGYP